MGKGYMNIITVKNAVEQFFFEYTWVYIIYS